MVSHFKGRVAKIKENSSPSPWVKITKIKARSNPRKTYISQDLSFLTVDLIFTLELLILERAKIVITPKTTLIASKTLQTHFAAVRYPEGSTNPKQYREIYANSG